MNQIEKWILSFFKPAAEKFLATLTENKAANLATIEASANAEGATVEGEVVAFVTSQAAAHGLEPIVGYAEPELKSLMDELVAKGDSTLESLYDGAVALATKDISGL